MAKGLKINDLQEGMGKQVSLKNIAHYHCQCRLANGEIIFNSRDRSIYQSRVGSRESFIALDQGLLGMRVGGKREIKVPPQLTYYEKEVFTSLPENPILYYEIILLDIVEQWDSTLHIRSSPLISKETKLLEEQFRQLEPSTDLNSEYQQVQQKLFQAAEKELKR